MTNKRTYQPEEGSLNYRAIQHISSVPNQKLNTTDICTALGIKSEQITSCLTRAVRGGVLICERLGHRNYYSLPSIAQQEEFLEKKTAATEVSNFSVALHSNGQLFIYGANAHHGGALLSASQTKELYEYLQHVNPLLSHLHKPAIPATFKTEKQT